MPLGKLYHALRIAIERLRVGRFEMAEAIDRQGILLEIVRRRSRPFLVFVLLAGLAAALDLQFGSFLEDAGLPGYFEDRLHLPSEEGLRGFASALAVAVATITAILLSISLVVLENAGHRYGGRFIRYLLGERVSGYILDLLFLTLLFSIWMIAFLLVIEMTPFFSIAALSLLMLVSVLSLPVYREHTLAMLAPRAPIDVLANEVLRMLRRIPLREKGGSRSVADWLRRNAAARLVDIESLIDPLLGAGRKDVESAIHMGLRLQGLVAFYASIEHRIPADSAWFPTVYETIPQANRFAFVEQRQMFDQLGLGRPVQRVPDRDWYERRVLGLLRSLVDQSFKVEAIGVPTGLLAQLEAAVERLMDLQSEFAFGEALSLAEQITQSSPQGSDSRAQAVNYAVAIGRLAIKGMDLSTWRGPAASMLKCIPQEHEVWKWGAPARVEQVLLQTRSKLELERTLMGNVVTPETWFRPEVEDELEKVRLDFEKRAFSSAVGCVSEVVRREGLRTDTGVAGIYGVFLLWHQCLRHGRNDLESLLPSERVKWAAVAVIELQRPEAPGKEWEAPLMDEIVSCCMLLLLECTRFEEFKGLVDPLAMRFLMPFTSDTEALDGMHRLQAVAGFALLISEIRGAPSLTDAVAERILHFLQDDPARWKLFEDRWDLALDYKLAFTYGLQESLTMKYHSYFLQAWEEIKDIGEAPIDTDRPWRTTLDHPSGFLRRHAVHGTVDPKDCAKEFLERLKTQRPEGGRSVDEGGKKSDSPESRSSDSSD